MAFIFSTEHQPLRIGYDQIGPNILNYAVKINFLEACNFVLRYSQHHLHFANVSVEHRILKLRI